jgi:hypothetical protein
MLEEKKTEEVDRSLEEKKTEEVDRSFSPPHPEPATVAESCSPEAGPLP